MDIVLAEAGDVLDSERHRLHMRLHRAVEGGIGLALLRDIRRRAVDLVAGALDEVVLVERRVRDAADVPQLAVDVAALRVDCIGHELPAGDLFGGPDSGREVGADGLGGNVCRLRDERKVKAEGKSEDGECERGAEGKLGE